ncbi:VOC family protein [soil metagenome]|jgi:PhnB protein
MTTINAYVAFNGKCREAMTFYQECLGGELTFQTFGDSPLGATTPDAMKNQVLHASLTKGPLLLMGSDMVGPGGFLKGNDIALSLNCSSGEEINSFYASLSADGRILDALKVQFWGAMFGVVEDKFGIRWMLHYDENQS